MLAMLEPSTPTSCSPCRNPRLRHRARHAGALDSDIMLAMLEPSTPTSCSPCWNPRLQHRARHAGTLDSDIMLAMMKPSTPTSCSPCWSPRLEHHLSPCTRHRLLSPICVTALSPSPISWPPSTRTSATLTDDNLIHPLAKHTPSSRGQAIPHILIVKIHAVPIHQKARPGRLPSAPDGLSDWWPHRAHNKRLDLTDANRYGAGPGASAIDRVRSSVAGVVQPTPGRTEPLCSATPRPQGLPQRLASHRLQHPLSPSSTRPPVSPPLRAASRYTRHHCALTRPQHHRRDHRLPPSSPPMPASSKLALFGAHERTTTRTPSRST